MKRLITLFLATILIFTILAIYAIRPGGSSSSNDVSVATQGSPNRLVDNEAGGFPSARFSSRVELVPDDKPGLKRDHFSPEMRRLVNGIYQGRPVTLRVADASNRYVFRSKRVTTEGFQISTGPNAELPASFEVFEGRQMLLDGSLVGRASLAVVNDSVSMTYSSTEGDFLVERGDDGLLRSQMLTSYSEASTWGQFTCQESKGIAGVVDASGDSPEPPAIEASITLAGDDDEAVPETEAAKVDHPYFRLGPHYDASLKNLNVLMISGSTQTGDSSNLSGKAATYFTYAARLADAYERQLGLRYVLQELILIANNSGQPDIEYDDSVTPNNKDSGVDDLQTVISWCNVHRPQSIYQWGHVNAWTLANSDGGGTVGWAYIDNYGSSTRGVSVNEKRWNWGVIIHELGHNVGASHTSGGAMNSSVSRSNPREDFFTENSANGGYTAATDIYNYMANPSRVFVTGPAALRNPLEMPFGVDDAVSTPTDTAVTFNPLTNDNTATPNFGFSNNLRLIEVGQVFPKVAGTAVVSGNEIVFTPVGGYAGKVWFSYTLSGDVGNDGEGWMHSADVVVTVGGDSSNPSQNPSISITDDIIRTDFSRDVRINPLLNDEGKGRLWAGGVDTRRDIDGAAESYSEGAFHLVSASVIVGNGSVVLETTDVTRDSAVDTPVSVQGNTGYLVYSPGSNEPSQVEIQYTVEDADGNQSTGSIFLNLTGTVSVASDVLKLVEREGRVGTISFTRTGSVVATEWVDFWITGNTTLVGANSDLAISGHDSFDAAQGFGRITIPAGQSTASLTVSVMRDGADEGAEMFNVSIATLESLLADPSSNTVSIQVTEASSISSVIWNEDFDAFPLNSTLSGGWTNAVSSVGVWTAENGQTGSSNTGPENDHTQGNGTGRYVYREASGNSNQQADLVSPAIDLTGAGFATVEFYYHMFGAAMGELRVDVFSGGVWNLDVMSPLVGQKQIAIDDPWALAEFDVSAYTTLDFQVRFRGITGDNFTSDISIDDVRIGSPVTLPTEGVVIVGQPQSQTLIVGDSSYLSVVARAFPAPTYQWKKDGVSISGATQSVLLVTSAEEGDQGGYTCEVTSGSTVASSVATLTVPIEPLTGLEATLGGSSVVLDWNQSEHPEFASYSVYRSESQGAYGSVLETGVFSNTYVDDSVVSGTTYYYVVTAVDSNSNESGFSNEASITFHQNLFAPSVDATPDDQTVALGGLTVVPPTAGAAISLDASLDDGLNPTWEDSAGPWDLPLDGSVIFVGNPGSSLPGILSAYDFPGGISGAGGGEGDGLANLDVNDKPFSLELWFKPDVSATYPANGQVLYETGGGTGLGVFYNDGMVEVAHDSNNGQISSDVSPLTSDFIQVVVTYDTETSSDNFRLYINGALQVTASRNDGDISGTDGAGLGQRGGSNVGGAGDGDSGTTSFDGQIALFRTYHDRVLTDPEVQQNYRSLSGGAGASVTLDGTVTDADGGIPPITLWTRASGPGLVSFSDASAISTTAMFNAVGTYELRLTADDGIFQTSDIVTVTVRAMTAAEAWRDQYFGQLENSGDAGSSIDFDGDGVANLLERAFGSAPDDSESVDLPTYGVAEENGTDYLTISYRRLIGGAGATGVDYAVDDLNYIVEYTTDFTIPWSSGSVAQVGNAVDNGDGTETVMIRLTTGIEAGADQVFVRLKVVSQP